MSDVNQGEFFDELEIMPPEKREQYFNQKLSQTVDHAYRHALAVREIFDRAKVSPSQIRVVKDLEKLPITRKTDLIEWQKATPPYGGFLAIPPEDVERIFISPGPIYEPLHTSSVKWFAKSFHAVGFRKGDIVLNTFTYHMSPAGILFHEAPEATIMRIVSIVAHGKNRIIGDSNRPKKVSWMLIRWYHMRIIVNSIRLR